MVGEIRAARQSRRALPVVLGLAALTAAFFLLALALGSTGTYLRETLFLESSDTAATIVWDIRFPRVVLACLVGSALSLGGLVFQALLRNPLAEPYILGISGGSAVGAILGLMLGLAIFPGVAGLSFLGSMLTLALIVLISSGQRMLRESSLLLAGVMINAFCSAVIMFLISVARSSELHNVLFWLMGDLSGASTWQVGVLLALLLPCFGFGALMARPMNLLLMGRETAQSLGVNVQAATLGLLAITSFMVSATVCLSGLVGFVGLVIPHLLRLIFGPDHRLLVPGCILGGASFLAGCDLLSRLLPTQTTLPVGVVTALIGAPVFIYLLCRTRS
jgi:iron complex transport system permease protein